MAVRMSSRPEHPMRKTLTDIDEYDNYVVRPKLTNPYPLRTLDACASTSLNIDLEKVDMLTQRPQSPWMTNPENKFLLHFSASQKVQEKKKYELRCSN
jgi:hypothetical protein